jgi:hypothetical protein
LRVWLSLAAAFAPQKQPSGGGRRRWSLALALAFAAAVAPVGLAAGGAAKIEWRNFAGAFENHALCGKYLVVYVRGTSAKAGPEEVRGTFLADEPGLAKLREYSFFCDVDPAEAPKEALAELRRRAELADDGKAAVVIVDCDGRRIEKALVEPTKEEIRDAVRVFAMYVAPERAEGKWRKTAEPRFELEAPPGWAFADVGEDAVLVAKEIDARAEVGTIAEAGDLAAAEETARRRVERAFPGAKWEGKPRFAGKAGAKKEGAIKHDFAAAAPDGKGLAGALRAELRDGVLAVVVVSGKAGRAKVLAAQADLILRALRTGLQAARPR